MLFRVRMTDSTSTTPRFHSRRALALITGLVTAAGLALTAIVAFQTAGNRRDALELAATAEASKAARLLEVRLEQDTLDIERMGARYTDRSAGTPIGEWRRDAQRYLNDKPWLRALEWADPDFRIQWVVPLEGNEAAVGLNLMSLAYVAPGIRTAVERRDMYITGAINLVQGGKGVVAYNPLFRDGAFEGLMIGVFSLEDTLLAVIPAIDRTRYRLTLVENDETVLSIGAAPEELAGYGTGVAQMRYRDLNWSIIAEPTRALAGTVQPGALFAVWLTGAALTALAAFATAAALSARRAAHLLRQTNRELAFSEERFELAVRGLAVGVWDWDLVRNRLTWSERALAIAGYGPDKVVDGPDFFADRIHPEDQKKVSEAASRHLETGAPYRVEYRFRRADGEYIWCRSSGQAVWNEEGRPIRFSGSMEDIDEVRQAVDALRASEARLRAMMRSSLDAVIIADGRGKVLEANPACASVFGYEPAELIGEPTAILMPIEDREKREAFVRHLLRSRNKSRLNARREDKARHKDGRTLPVELSIVEATSGGKRIFIITARDLTRRKKIEAERAEFVSRLEEANAGLERFNHAASHDLREPLRMVANFSQLLLRKHADKLDEEGRRALEISADSAKRMQALLDDLIAFSRAGEDSSQSQDFSPADAISMARDNLAEAITESGAAFETRDLPDTLFGSRIRFGRVIQYLVSNAIKYAQADRQPEITISAARDHAGWRITVADNGIGMRPEYTEQIFEPFTRLHGPREYSGTGMGLAICRKIVENAGGRIWAESVPGEGSRFHIHWPDRPASEGSQTR